MPRTTIQRASKRGRGRQNSPGSRRRKAHILIVDDEALNREVYAGTLATGGYEIRMAKYAQEAMVEIEHGWPDVVLMDIMMPGMRGIEALGRIRRTDETLPIIMTTSTPTVDVAIQALRLRACDFLLKRATPEDLLQSVGQALQVPRARRRRALKDAGRLRLQQLFSLIEVGQLLASAVGTSELLHRIIRKAMDIVKAEVASLYLREVNGKMQEVATVAANGQKPTDEPAALELASVVAETGEPILITDGARDQRFSPERMATFSFRTLLAIPIRIRGQIVGVLEVRNKLGRTSFNDEDLEFLLVIAGQAGTAMENERLHSALEEQRSRVAETHRRQANLLDRVARDVRPHLTAVTESLRLLIDRTADPLSRTPAQHAADALASSSELASALDDLLDLSDIEAGALSVTPAPCSLSGTLAEVRTHLSSTIARKHLEMEAHVSPELGIIVLDPARVRQLLRLLLGTAARLSPDGATIRVLASKQRLKSEAESVLLHLLYAGGQDSAEPDWNSLHLTLARRLTALLGGQLRVERASGTERAFVLTLPCQAPATILSVPDEHEPARRPGGCG